MSSVQISVIVPTYNRVTTILRALDSIVSQSHPPHEIIVIDDGSDDGTEDELRKCTGEIRYIRQEHAGPGAARNRGAQAASGEWLSFLDSDDWYYADRLLDHARWISREPTLECIFGACDFVHADGSLITANVERSEAGRRLISTAEGTKETKLGFDDLAAFGFEDFGHANTFSIRRDRFLALGGFPVEFSIGEDTFFWMKVAAACNEIGIILESNACCVQHDDNTFKRGSLSANEGTVRARIAMLKASARHPAPLRKGIRRRLRRDRRDLGYAYIRAGQRADAVLTVLPSLWEYPSYTSLRNLVSILRG